MSSSLYTIERKNASEILSVSERTLDRYIRSGKLTCKKIGRKVLLSEQEIQRLSAEIGSETPINTVDIVDKAPIIEEKETKAVARTEETPVRGDIYMKVENVVYKHLYEKVNTELAHKEDDIKMLNYKLGKLETQIKNTVPLLDFRRTEDSLSKVKELHQKELAEKDARIEETYKMYNLERINKFVYLSLFGGVTGIAAVAWILQTMFA